MYALSCILFAYGVSRDVSESVRSVGSVKGEGVRLIHAVVCRRMMLAG